MWSKHLYINMFIQIFDYCLEDINMVVWDIFIIQNKSTAKK